MVSKLVGRKGNKLGQIRVRELVASLDSEKIPVSESVTVVEMDSCSEDCSVRKWVDSPAQRYRKNLERKKAPIQLRVRQ